MAVAVFDYAKWAALFPELAGSVDEQLAGSFFTVAGLLLDNTDCSPVQDVTARLVYLNYIVAHLASLSGYPLAAGQTVPAPSGVIGRVTKATEGSVSVESSYGEQARGAAYWLQTSYGALFWQLTAWLRLGRYVPAAPRYFGPRTGYGRRF